MRLKKLKEYVQQRGWKYTYAETDGLGSLDFESRGISYHVWEFFDSGEYGAESNVRTAGRQEDYTGDYEETILAMLRQWH